MKLLISTHFVEVDYSNNLRIMLWGFFVVYDVKCVTHFGKLISTLPFNSRPRCQELIQLSTNFAPQFFFLPTDEDLYFDLSSFLPTDEVLFFDLSSFLPTDEDLYFYLSVSCQPMRIYIFTYQSI